MTQRQFDYVEEALIDAIDIIVCAMKKRKATPEEVAILPEIAFVLVKLQEC